MANIGVFDSGVGGQSVATALSLALPDDEIIFINDHENVPYGTKSESELYDLALPKLQQLVEKDCEIIVIACNSVSTTIIDRLKKILPVPLIAVEPMIEEAAGLSEQGIIAVCATPTTLASARYKELRHKYANSIAVIEPDCSEWAFMIENDVIDRARIIHTIEDVLSQGADVIVLGCTHYHWIESLIKSVAGDKSEILQPEPMIIKRVKRELGRTS